MPQPGATCHRALSFPRTACRRCATPPHVTGTRSQWEENDVNHIVERIEPNHGRDRGHDTRCGGCSDASRTALDVQAAVTSDRTDQQTEHKTFQHASDDVANE